MLVTLWRVEDRATAEFVTRFYSRLHNGAPPAERISHDFLAGRMFPQLGLTWSYPLAHRGPENTAIIEPVAVQSVTSRQSEPRVTLFGSDLGKKKRRSERSIE